jgi:hypothetical protein
MRDAGRGSTHVWPCPWVENFYVVYGKRSGMEESLMFPVKELGARPVGELIRLTMTQIDK